VLGFAAQPRAALVDVDVVGGAVVAARLDVVRGEVVPALVDVLTDEDEAGAVVRVLEATDEVGYCPPPDAANNTSA
jgi:hypothetical protein